MDLHFELEDDLFWAAATVLPSWAGFQSRGGAYGSQDTAKPSDGTVRVVFAPEGRDTSPLTTEDITLIEWFLQREALVSAAVLSSLLKAYPALQRDYGYSGKEKTQLMPDVLKTADFRNLIELHTVFVHPLDKNDGVPYLGFELGCTWDTEHGLGVLMHGFRAVKVGGADTAFLLWIAQQDAEA